MRFPTTFNTWSVVLLAAAMVMITRTAATYHDPTALSPITVSIHIDRVLARVALCGYYRIVGTSRASRGFGRVVCFLSSCTSCTCVPIIHVPRGMLSMFLTLLLYFMLIINSDGLPPNGSPRSVGPVGLSSTRVFCIMRPPRSTNGCLC